jgi:hypothetical protein
MLAILSSLLAGAALSQTQPTQTPAASQVIGEVTALDAQSRQISLKPDQGEAVTVIGPRSVCSCRTISCISGSSAPIRTRQ